MLKLVTQTRDSNTHMRVLLYKEIVIVIRISIAHCLVKIHEMCILMIKSISVSWTAGGGRVCIWNTDCTFDNGMTVKLVEGGIEESAVGKFQGIRGDGENIVILNVWNLTFQVELSFGCSVVYSMLNNLKTNVWLIRLAKLYTKKKL